MLEKKKVFSMMNAFIIIVAQYSYSDEILIYLAVGWWNSPFLVPNPSHPKLWKYLYEQIINIICLI